MKTILGLHLWEGREYDHRERDIVLFKTVDYSCLPRKGDVVNFGISEHDEKDAVSAYVNQTYWSSDGSAIIDMSVTALGATDEYEEIIECAKQDGFLEYAAWKETDVRA